MDKKIKHTKHNYKGHDIIKILNSGMEVYHVKDMPEEFYKQYWDGMFDSLKSAKKYIDMWENETVNTTEASTATDNIQLKSIFASKLYKGSTRKERIHAAMLAPGNLSLVQQLAESLDEEYKIPENFGIEEEEKKESEEETPDFISDEEIDPEKDLVTIDDIGKSSAPKHSSSHASAPSFKPSEGSEVEKSEVDTSELMPDSPMTEEPKKEEKEAEASTKIMSATVADLNVLKGTLNGREDTAGVARIAEKENEVWIYYNDDVNLNNIMTDVIEFLMDSGYEDFEFNRLARSDNAIVFVRVTETRDYPDKSVEEVLEEQK